MRFSIIVPVYNVEKYLHECVDSILAQSFSDYEVILVDDGSTDQSSLICDEYSRHYEKIKVIHKSNGGLSEARNYGIVNSVGEYCIFVDSDDWIINDCLSEFDSIIERENPEVIITRLTRSTSGKLIHCDENYKDYLREELTRKRAIEWMLKYSEDTWPVVRLVVSRELINNNKMSFSVGRLHEDEDWTKQICYHTQKYSGYEGEWYCYRINRDDSITNHIGAANIIDPIEMATKHIYYCKNNDIYLKDLIINTTVMSVYNIVNRINECRKEDVALISSCIEKNMDVFELANKFKYKILLFSMKTIGVKWSLFLLRFVNTVRKRMCKQ